MRAALLPTLAFLLAACGARTTVPFESSGAQGSGAAGGAGGSGSSSVTSTSSSMTTSSSTGGGGSVCDALVLVNPVTVAPTPSLARAPQIGVPDDSGDMFLAFIEAPFDAPGLLRAARMLPFSVWPPEFGGILDLETDIIDYVTGPGPAGPVGLLRHGSDGAGFLATTFLPQLEGITFVTGGDGVLFVTAIPDRYLGAQASQAPGYDVLDVGSYQPGSLPQSEGPDVCITSSVLGAAVNSGTGFIAAFVEPSAPEPTCNPQFPLPGSDISLMRYESPPGLGSSLDRKEGERLSAVEPILHLQMTPASFGAWVVVQTDGSTSRVQPGIAAFRVDAGAQRLVPDEIIRVSPDGVTWGPIAVAALGDALAVAWVEAIDPSAPTIVVQIVEPGGALGAAVAIPTHEAWFAGEGLRLHASPDGRGLLVAWDGNNGGALIGLARLDCIGGS